MIYLPKCVSSNQQTSGVRNETLVIRSVGTWGEASTHLGQVPQGEFSEFLSMMAEADPDMISTGGEIERGVLKWKMRGRILC